MDHPPSEDDNDTPFLIDSGTESITESPVADEDSEQSEDSTVCDIHSESKERRSRPQNLLDKSFSLDEPALDTPLQPVQLLPTSIIAENGCSSNENSLSDASGEENDDGISEEGFPEEAKLSIPAILETDLDPKLEMPNALPSILRRPSATASISPRKVSFPRENLVTYKEPDYDAPWKIEKELPTEEILQVYQNSCKRHNTIELDTIKNQIQEIKNNINHSSILNLNCVKITSEVNETLEDVLKVANFNTLILNECVFTPETISEFLNMLEFYESIRQIEIATDFDEETWKCFCTTCRNINVLESLAFKGIKINEQYTRNLVSTVNGNASVTILRFDNCILSKLPNFHLVDGLMTNTTIRELYLPSTGLYTKEADVLGRFLQNNLHLKVLDISNNCIGDRGLEALARGLVKQKVPDEGLSVLIVFNNQITEKSSSIICNILEECKNLRTLNLGYNNLTDEALIQMSASLEKTISLEGLGLQCTLLTCKGLISLAEAIQANKSLQKINLKGNKAIQTTGIEKLCEALTKTKISKLEIDETNRSCSDPEAYIKIVKQINAICTVNKNYENNSEEEIATVSQLISRKMSLSCEPKNIMPDMPPPSAPRGRKNRFSISRVPEATIRTNSSITAAPLSPDEEITNRFANVRNSVDSLTANSDSDH